MFKKILLRCLRRCWKMLFLEYLLRFGSRMKCGLGRRIVVFGSGCVKVFVYVSLLICDIRMFIFLVWFVWFVVLVLWLWCWWLILRWCRYIWMKLLRWLYWVFMLLFLWIRLVGIWLVCWFYLKICCFFFCCWSCWN